MDNPVRFAIGVLLAIVAAVLLISSIGKPPEWNPTIFGLRPQGLGGRDRIRIYAVVAVVAGILLAVFFGVR
jgi:hypothetical protein